MALQNKHHRCFFVLVLLLVWGGLQAQSIQETEISGVRMLAHSDGRQVKLRWAPTNWPLWEQLRKSGVYLERHTVLRNGNILPPEERLKRTVITDSLLIPASPGVMSVRAEFDPFIGVGGQAYYGETFIIDDRNAASGLLSQSREIDDRYSFGLFAADQSFEAATLMALAYVDTKIDPRETYVYRLRSADPTLQLDSVRMGYVSVNAGEITVSPGVTALDVTFGNLTAMLKWARFPASEWYTSYFIERSTDGLNWERRNKTPFLPIVKNQEQEYFFYPDSLAVNGRPYFYRVIGRTPFGEDGLPSDPVQGLGIPEAGTMAPFIRSVTPDPSGGLIVKWGLNGAGTQVQKLELLRAVKALGPFSAISDELPATATGFTDPSPMPSNYYKVIATDVYGRTEESYAALGMPIDSIPPAAPVNVRGVILKDGKVVLSWDANTEQDIGGYRVYLSNKPDSEFSLASPRPEPGNYFVGQTTLNTLSRKMYAKVVALDYHMNNSAFSAAATLERPDTIPPTTPLFTAVVADSSGVTFSWVGSESPDLDGHVLYSRVAGDTDWTVVQRFPYPESTIQRAYLVQNMEPDVETDFRLEAVDLSGLATSSVSVRSVRIGSPLRASVEKVVALADRREHVVNLRWSYRKDRGELDHFVVYRSPVASVADTEPVIPSAIGRLPATKQEAGRRGGAPAYAYQDPTPKMNTAYRYYVRAVYADGGMSRLSPPVEIQY